MLILFLILVNSDHIVLICSLSLENVPNFSKLWPCCAKLCCAVDHVNLVECKQHLSTQDLLHLFLDPEVLYYLLSLLSVTAPPTIIYCTISL